MQPIYRVPDRENFRPLLPLGWHFMDISAVRRLCVARFPESLTRPRLMAGLERVIERLNGSGLHLELWVGGSFVTEKLNPNDCDVAVEFRGEEYDAAGMAQKRIIDWASGDGPWNEHRCDCAPFPVYPEGHALYAYGQWRRAYWLNKFGYDGVERRKGLAVVRLPFFIT